MDLSIDWIGRLMVVGLFQQPFLDFCASYAKTSERAAPDAVGALPVILDGEADPEPENIDPSITDSTNADNAKGEEDWHAEQAKTRRIALKFMSPPSFPFYIIMLRFLIEPLRIVLTDKIKLAEKTFELLQREVERLRLAAEGLDPRTFRVLFTALNSSELRAVAEVNSLLCEPAMSCLFDTHAYTEDKGGWRYRHHVPLSSCFLNTETAV